MSELETDGAVLKFIQEYQHQHPFSPTYREIADGCQLRMSQVRRALDRLEKRGLIWREPNAKRAITLIKLDPSTKSGRCDDCGKPIAASIRILNTGDNTGDDPPDEECDAPEPSHVNFVSDKDIRRAPDLDRIAPINRRSR